jgi:hypothetical protein
MKRASPIQRRCSVPRSRSAMIPTHCVICEMTRLPPVVTENRSSLCDCPLITFSVAVATSNPSLNSASGKSEHLSKACSEPYLHTDSIQRSGVGRACWYLCHGYTEGSHRVFVLCEAVEYFMRETVTGETGNGVKIE